jgi:hypothetical protein
MYLCWWRTCGADSRRDHERARLLAADRDGGAGASVEASDGGVVVVSRVRSTVPREVAGSISARQVTMHVPGSASPGPDGTCPSGTGPATARWYCWAGIGTWEGHHESRFGLQAVRLPPPGNGQAARGALPGTAVIAAQIVVFQCRRALGGRGAAAGTAGGSPPARRPWQRWRR